MIRRILTAIRELFANPKPPTPPEPRRWTKESNVQCIVCCATVPCGELVCPKHGQRLLATKPRTRPKRAS